MILRLLQKNLNKAHVNELSDKLYNEAIGHYQQKIADIAATGMPVFKNIRKDTGRSYRKCGGAILPMEKKESRYWPTLIKQSKQQGRELVNALERQITLAFIDDAWKEHLRAMDDLKQSVQTAYLEQKDPLVIYKIKAFDLFKQMDGEVNKDIVSFLCHAAIPMEQQGKATRRTDP